LWGGIGRGIGQDGTAYMDVGRRKAGRKKKRKKNEDSQVARQIHLRREKKKKA